MQNAKAIAQISMQQVSQSRFHSRTSRKQQYSSLVANSQACTPSPICLKTTIIITVIIFYYTPKAISRGAKESYTTSIPTCIIKVSGNTTLNALKTEVDATIGLIVTSGWLRPTTLSSAAVTCSKNMHINCKSRYLLDILLRIYC